MYRDRDHRRPLPMRIALATGIVTLVLGSFLLMAALLSQGIADPLVATIVLGSTVFLGVITLRRIRPQWLQHEPAPPALRQESLWWVIGALLMTFVAGQAFGMVLYLELGSSAFDKSIEQRQVAGGLVTLGLVLLTAPLGEEALFRGLLQPLLRRQVGLPATMLTTSLLFAGLHGNIVQLASTLPLGIALALLYEHTRALWPCVLAHLGFNVLALLVPTYLIQAVAGPVEAIFLIIVCAGYLTLWHQRTIKRPVPATSPAETGCTSPRSQVRRAHPPNRSSR